MLRTDFTLTTPMLVGAVAILLCISLGASYQWGKSNGINEMKEAAVIAEQQWNKRVEAVKDEYESSLEAIRDEYVAKTTSLQKQIDTLQRNPKTITKYISKSDNAKIPTGFMLWHDKSARGENLAEVPSVILNNDDCKYSLMDVGLVVSKNYTSCLECMEKLTALQKIVKEFQLKQRDLKK